jgi:hypothetical protein
MATKKKTAAGDPCESCGGAECGTGRIPVCCDACSHRAG